jgi:REP element-mobilizing transposase RayT
MGRRKLWGQACRIVRYRYRMAVWLERQECSIREFFTMPSWVEMGGKTICFDDKDCRRFCLLIQEGIERFGHRIHAFCLMRNHVHLAVQVGNISLSRILQNLSFPYTRWVNGRQSRTGHLFQGRYRAILVDGDVYLKELTRYIHLRLAVVRSRPQRWARCTVRITGSRHCEGLRRIANRDS